MTFQPNNIYEPWRFEYVSYNLIKQNMTNQAQNHGWFERDESSFVASLWHEAEKVDRFIIQKQREIESTMAHCRRSLEQHPSNNHSNFHTTETLYDIYCELQGLCDFARHNALALQCLIDLHDELTGRNQRYLLVEILQKKPLDRQRFDVTLVEVTKLMDKVVQSPSPQQRHPQQPQYPHQQLQNQPLVPVQEVEEEEEGEDKNQQGGEPAWPNEPTAVNFWVHKDNIKQVHAILSFHLSSSSSKPTVTFLDSPRFELYQGRLERDEGAEEIRLKHFANGSKDVFVERETYHPAWMNGQSVTDGFRLDSLDKADQFLSSQYTAEEAVNDLCATDAERHTMGFIATGIQKSVHEKQLRPVMRMTSERIAFQNQALLDTNIMYVGGGDGSNDKYTLSHAVLQTTLIGRPRDQEAAWLRTLLDDGLIYEVPCFSLYLHGMACLWRYEVPLLPWWMKELGVDIRDARQPRGFKSSTHYNQSRSLRPLDEPLGYLNHELEYPKIPPSERPAMKQGLFPAPRHETISIDQDFFHDPVWGSKSPSGTRAHQEDDYGSRQRGVAGQRRQDQNSEDQERQTLLDYGGLTIYDNNDDYPEIQEVVEDDNEEKKKKKKDKKAPWLEPKVFFANERTFIHWLQFSALILTAALTLLNFGDRVSTIAGGVFFGISLAIALYAFGRYRYRAHQIKTRPQVRYDDIYGPIGLCVLLVGALILNFILRYNSPSSTTSWLGISSNGTQTQTYH
ncbi:VTC domain-containing protein [Phascolomyces articulosus]|uniref:VTC domain-containing protein n=1 Tax=Phascolomyces articulosus TaxID=60185 RepID=A0AAD5PF61_9FUNG|nr:VTC domain-containing protein [Phascolomyces articulosus]